MKKLLIISLVSSSILFTWCFKKEISLENTENLQKEIIQSWTSQDLINQNWITQTWVTKENSWIPEQTSNWSNKTQAYIIEKNNVYWIDQLNNKIEIENADILTFEIINHWYNRDYAKDKNKVYVIIDKMRMYDLVTLKDADPSSFQILDDRYSKDKNYVFWSGIQLKWADSNTFTNIDDFYWKDKNHVYIFDMVIDWADQDSFEVLDNIDWVLSQDKNYKYEIISENPEESKIVKTPRK